MSTLLAELRREKAIVVTGVGAYSAAGDSVDALWKAAVAGKSLATWKDLDDGQGPSPFAVCSAPEIDVSQPALRPVRRLDRSAQMAWLAAGQALSQARLAEAYPPERIGIMVGSSRGPLGKRLEAWRQRGARIRPSLASDSTFGMLAGALAQAFRIRGPGATISTTCASGAFAIGMGAEQLLMGRADAMIVGATEAPLRPALLEQLQATGVIGFHEHADQACRPFDVNRNGIVIGEGSAFLVLESGPAAAARGVEPLAYLPGWAFSLDNSGRTGVDREGSALVQTMNEALRFASLSPDDLGYINAHGTGTLLNDAAEAKAVRTLLGERADHLPCTSTKPVTGHCLGATPAIEAVLCIEALRHQTVPPTANCRSQDPECAIDVQPLVPRPARISRAMSNSLGFWGYHASLILSRDPP